MKESDFFKSTKKVGMINLKEELKNIDNFFDNLTTEEFEEMLIRNGITETGDIKKIWKCCRCNARHKYLGCKGPKPKRCDDCGCEDFV